MSASPTSSSIPQDLDGHIDLDVLRARCSEYADRPLIIGSFSAASNVTGIVTDTDAISTLLHEHGALAFWDFAAAAPYVDIEMYGEGGRGVGDPAAYKDAVFLSPHKFIGGPSTPGVLVVRRELLTNRVPDVPGGGTVAYVNPDDARLPHRPGAPRGGRHPRHHRVDPRRAGLQAQGGRRRRRSAPARRSSSGGPSRPGSRSPPSRSSATSTPSGSRSSPSSCARAGRAPPAPQLRRRRAQRPLRHPGPRRLLVRRPLRPRTCSASTSSARTSSSARSGGAARASSRAGCGSTSTTSSPTPSPTTSSRRCASSLATAGGCSATTTSTRRAGSGATSDGPVEPPLRLRQVGFERGRPALPAAARPRRRGRCSPDHLEQGRADPGGRHARRPAPRRSVNADFDHLRWFDLPATSLRQRDRRRVRADA